MTVIGQSLPVQLGLDSPPPSILLSRERTTLSRRRTWVYLLMPTGITKMVLGDTVMFIGDEDNR